MRLLLLILLLAEVASARGSQAVASRLEADLGCCHHRGCACYAVTLGCG